METVKFANIPQSGSRLVYGTGVPKVTNDDMETAFETLDRAFAAGFRTFDTANQYGHAERNLGAWMEARGLRDQIVLHDKGVNPGQIGSDDVLSGESIRSFVEESLRRLRTDRLDFYLLHRDQVSCPVGEVVETFNALKEEGKIIHFGVSNWTMERIMEADRYAAEHGLTAFKAVSPCFNIGTYISDPWGGSIALTGSPEADAYRQWLGSRKDLVISTYSALGRGFFCGKWRTDSGIPVEEVLPKPPIEEYFCDENVAILARMEEMAAKKGLTVAQISIAWLLNQPLFVYPIVSPTGDHIPEIVAAADVKLSVEEVNWLASGR